MVDKAVNCVVVFSLGIIVDEVISKFIAITVASPVVVFDVV